MRVAVLWATLTGYMNVSLKALAAMPEVSLFVSDNTGETKQAPFAERLFSWIAPENRYPHDGSPDAQELIRRLEEFDPEVLFVASWSTPAYNAACRHFRGRAVRVCAMDNQWRGSLKQWLGVATAPIFVQRLFDAVAAAGERQSIFARRLGFDRDHTWQAMYCPDYEGLSAVRLGEGVARPHTFLFVGRLVEDKSIALMVTAYKRYRERSRDPWPLHIVGAGVLESELRAIPGVVLYGFVQPYELPAIFGANGCFLLPSRYEPWGVVIQEAAVAGLPIVCTEECGASVHYVVDGYNGCVVKTGSVDSLTAALMYLGSRSEEELGLMSKASLALSEQQTPARWASYFLEKAADLQMSLRLVTKSGSRTRREIESPAAAL